MSVPFSPARVSRFLVLFVLALFAFWGLYILLTHVRARQSITPQHAVLQTRPESSRTLSAGAKV